MSKLYEAILDVVRIRQRPGRGLDDLLRLCHRRSPSKHWRTLPDVDVDGDVELARKWFAKVLPPRATGIYLGLDTLNMQDGEGYNLEFGASSSADPADSSTDWLFEGLTHRTNHLIAGLLPMKRVYSKFPDEVAEFADYALFLGYSGIVLAAAIDALEPKVRAGHKGRLYVWGFHDGDLFRLMQVTAARRRRIARE